MKEQVIVICGACEEESDLKEWETPTTIDGRFVGGCPTCHGEFYDIRNNSLTGTKGEN